MYERRGVGLTRRFFLLFVSIALGSSCFLPPDPPIPEDETDEAQGREMIRGAWDPQTETAEERDETRRREMIRGAWDSPPEVAGAPGGEASSGAGRTAMRPQVDADAVMAGHWSAEILPPDSETMPEVSLSLFDAAGEGEVVGTATYAFTDYACHYALVLVSSIGSTVELSQRWGVGPCAEAGRIVLEWGEDEDLVGDWRRPDGSRWFQVRLAPTPPLDAEIESESTSRRGPGWMPGADAGGG
jgi:hypothetical protein